RNYHSGFRVAAETRTIRHLDPFVMDQRLLDRLQRFRKLGPDDVALGLVGDDHVLAVDETIGAGGVARPRRRHSRELWDVICAHDGWPWTANGPMDRMIECDRL